VLTIRAEATSILFNVVRFCHVVITMTTRKMSCKMKMFRSSNQQLEDTQREALNWTRWKKNDRWIDLW